MDTNTHTHTHTHTQGQDQNFFIFNAALFSGKNSGLTENQALCDRINTSDIHQYTHMHTNTHALKLQFVKAFVLF